MVKNWNDFQSNMMNNVMSPWFGSKKTNFNENSQSNSDNNGENNNNFNHKTPNFQYKSK